MSIVVVAPKTVANLQGCVASFGDVADQIIVCNDEPDHAMREVAQALSCQWIELEEEDRADRSPGNTAALWNRALATACHPWVLVVEGDERVSPDLAKELQCTLLAGPKCEAFRIPRRRVYLGHVTRFGADRNDAPVRLFRRGRGQFQAGFRRPELRVDAGSMSRLKSKLMLFVCWQVTELLHSIDQRASDAAASQFCRGRRPNWLGALARAAGEFFRHYLWKLGLLDGRAGLQLSLFAAFESLLIETKLWELRHAKRLHDPSATPPRTAMPLFRLEAQNNEPRKRLRRAS